MRLPSNFSKVKAYDKQIGNPAQRFRRYNQTMTQRYGIGFIGLGSIGQRMLVPAQRHERIKPTMAWDPQTERLSQTVANAPGLRAAKDVNHLINDSAVDIVYIASPPLTHAEHANAALAAGKPVLCEKPLGIDIITSETLAARATSSGIPHAVNFIYGSAYPAEQMAKALAQSKFGTLTGAQVQLHLPHWAARRYAEAPWLTASDQGGFVREVLSHFVYLTERLFGPTQVNYSYCREGSLPGSAITGLVAELSCGDLTVNIQGSTLGTGPDVCNYTLWGEHCSYRVHDLHGLQITTGKDWENANAPDTDPVNSWYQRQYDQVAAMLDGRPHTLPDFAAGLSVQRVIETLLQGEPA